MEKKLFLLDGMALVYRAHFALVARPIFSSKGVNTSALYGFTQTLLEILKNQQPTHIAVAFDTEAPTQRHADFAGYKATRETMPEDIRQALPHVRRMLDALRVPVLTCDGFEADDIIATIVRAAAQQGFQCYMVTPDKDFGQLVNENTFVYKPSRMGDGVEIMGLPEIQKRWGIQRAEQVVDVLALMGDASDNIPGVPGIGEKTAMKLIGQYGTVENVLAHAGELTGRPKTSLEAHREDALLSKRLATLICDAPCAVDLESLKVQPPDEEKLKAMLIEFEFNSIGRRLFGDSFKAGRGFQQKTAVREESGPARAGAREPAEDLILEMDAEPGALREAPPAVVNLKKLADIPHHYSVAASAAERAALLKQLQNQERFCLDIETTSLDAKSAQPVGLAFSFAPRTGYYVPLAREATECRRVLEEFRPVLESDRIEKVGHNLKFDLSVLKWHGFSVGGKLFDTMVAHSLLEPDMRHSLEYLAETHLGYSPIPIASLIGETKAEQRNMADVPLDKIAAYATEDADLALQLRGALEPLLKEKKQERVFYEIESPLISVLVDMEYEGIKVDAGALAEFAAQLSKQIDEQEKMICRLAGTTFNLNSPRQLGQILFDVMKICTAAKKTKTGQYATDEQTLMALAPEHEIVQRLLDHRAATKLKSTYADALPLAIWQKTGRVHTTFNQVMTTTGRLNSQDPNLQNIPIRTERGQEIRKAFVPRGEQYALLSADYSQIELRIIAALSHETALIEAFNTGADIHTATAAKVFGVAPEAVNPEMRRKAKMVNYGIAYGISAFGLAQRLGIARKEAAGIIEQYFKQFPGIRTYMDRTIASARKEGYVETVTGRRRYIRDIRSSNNTLRSAAERNAINAPIQGTAADMIKLAMIHIHRELTGRQLKTRMLLQVHDELVFDLFKAEEGVVRGLAEEKMKTAIPLDVPIVVEIGVGRTWLAAH
ncbi:MAG TPA: DNA polymerase I [Verrucomicrobiae bacterium]|nr:DNA polymerase I [Verrucomicrobiae bacterium]